MSGFCPGLDVRARREPMGFAYGPGVFGPPAEMRSLDAIRPSLHDPACDGPDPVYAIVMDVGREERRAELHGRHLLFGVVTSTDPAPLERLARLKKIAGYFKAGRAAEVFLQTPPT